MADEENKIKKWFYKWKKDKGDTVKDKLRSTEPEDSARQAQPNLQGENKGTLEENLRSTDRKTTFDKQRQTLDKQNRTSVVRQKRLIKTASLAILRRLKNNLNRSETGLNNVEIIR